MANFLEQLVAEWYEFQGYFVRRNVKVGRRSAGGWDSELDVVAFNPLKKHLVHIECSTDADNYRKRQERFKKKFDAGRKPIRALFKGLNAPRKIEKIVLHAVAKPKNYPVLGGGKVVTVREFMKSIYEEELKDREMSNAAIPEQFPLLRALHFAAYYWEVRL